MRPVALHVRITEDTDQLIALLGRLERELPEKPRNPYGGYGSGKGGHHALAAWNNGVAMLLLDIHQGVREAETDIRYSVSGTLRSRGGSPGNTVKCLLGLPSLCAGADYSAVVIVARRLESWIWRGRIVLGETEPVSRFPRLPGYTEPGCPFCHTAGSLRVRHATGVVVCLRPTCRDGDGNRPSGRIEIGTFSAEPLIAWADGTTGVNAGAAAA